MRQGMGEWLRVGFACSSHPCIHCIHCIPVRECTFPHLALRLPPAAGRRRPSRRRARGLGRRGAEAQGGRQAGHGAARSQARSRHAPGEGGEEQLLWLDLQEGFQRFASNVDDAEGPASDEEGKCAASVACTNVKAPMQRASAGSARFLDAPRALALHSKRAGRAIAAAPCACWQPGCCPASNANWAPRAASRGSP